MADHGARLLIAGVTTRALAVSAANAGWAVTAVDAFGDLDLRARAVVMVPPRHEGGFDPSAAARLAREVTAEAVAYTSNFENRSTAVSALAKGRRLLGNPAAVLDRVRSPFELMRALKHESLDAPATRASPPRPGGGGPERWLLKPRRSGGGHGTSPWRRGQPVSRQHYLQERIEGRAGSAVLLADGRRCILLGPQPAAGGPRQLRLTRLPLLRQPDGRGSVPPGIGAGRARPRRRGDRRSCLRTRGTERHRLHRPGRCALADRSEPALLRFHGAAREGPEGALVPLACRSVRRTPPYEHSK